MFLFWSYNRFKDEKVFMPIEFKEYYTLMPIDYEDVDSNDKIFADLNIDSNPLSNETYQKWIRENQVGHTSMSMGDIIYDDKERKYYVCSSGWHELIWIDRG